MRRIALVGDIGSGKTFCSKLFRYPVFNADLVVSNLYQKDKFLFGKIKKKFPNEIRNFPLKKEELLKIIFQKKKNLNILGKIIHPIVRKKMKNFLKKNKNKKFVILDIPLLIENKIFHKNDVLVFVDSKKIDIDKKIKKRQNFNIKILNMFKKIQLSPNYKKQKAHFIIKNTFTKNPVKKEIKKILKEIS